MLRTRTYYLLWKLLLAPTLVIAQTPGAPPISALERARRATVFLEVTSARGTVTGSGVVITPDGLIATAAHVVEGASSVQVTLLSGERYSALGILDYDGHMDIAVIAIPGFGLATATLGNSDSLAPGQRVLAIGAPLGLQATVSDGIVSAVRLEDGAMLAQISVPVSPGSSGGPLLAQDGSVVGLIISGIRGNGAENLNFARPINYLRGRLAAIQGRSPIPFSSYTYAASGRGSPDAPGASIGRLNAFLSSLPWRSLDGASIYQKKKGSNQVQVHIMITYAVSEDPLGRLILDRRAYAHYRFQGLVTGTDLGRGDAVTSWLLDSTTNHFTSTYQFEPFTLADTRDAWDLSVDGTRYSYHTAKGLSHEGTAPLGVVPLQLAGAVIAALPDSLPSQLSFWVLDPALDRALQAKVRFGDHSRRAIPVAKQGTQCVRGQTDTEFKQFEVVQITLQIGTESDQGYVLMNTPHLRVDDDVICIRLPDAPIAP